MANPQYRIPESDASTCQHIASTSPAHAKRLHFLMILTGWLHLVVLVITRPSSVSSRVTRDTYIDRVAHARAWAHGHNPHAHAQCAHAHDRAPLQIRTSPRCVGRFFIRVGSGACQLPISGVSWVTGEWTRRGERERAEPRPRAGDCLLLKGRSKHRRDAYASVGSEPRKSD